HDWSARLVSCSAAFVVVVLTWWWARRAAGPRVAVAAALVLTLTARFLYLARMLTPDSILCACVVLCWLGLHLALAAKPAGESASLRDPRWKWLLLSALGCGLGVLTKGPVAILLALVPAAAWHLLQSPCVRLR